MQPHQQRVVDEKNELCDKLGKLLTFLQTDFYKTLREEERELLYFLVKFYNDELNCLNKEK